eukprot:11190669-Lingulodinium_polyedra.AAC.1
MTPRAGHGAPSGLPSDAGSVGPRTTQPPSAVPRQHTQRSFGHMAFFRYVEVHAGHAQEGPCCVVRGGLAVDLP